MVKSSLLIVVVPLLLLLVTPHLTTAMSRDEKLRLRDQVLQMFDHAFDSYMRYAFPADELMPLSCKGRYRDSEKSRGDIDEVLGNFTLTLVDSLDTLALLGRIDQFEQAVRNVIKHTSFDRDLVISVFESNIRMLGGLLGGHVSLVYMRDNLDMKRRFSWYNNELLLMAKDLGVRLLPAFNTSTGLPMSRINLKRGVTPELANSEKDKYTCTACAGTLLLEFALLSRLTGDKVFEDKVRKTMDFIWEKRNRASDLVGTTINVNDGEWLVKDASIGAGIDSYYEYLFKGYILLGDETFLYRFNRHYDSIMKYMNLNSNGAGIGDGSLYQTVHMHMPNRQAKNYMDALLAFWPGLQVLKGDLKAAIKMHETLHQIVKKHDFIPEAVLFDHSVHWPNHPLRPEFLESTYHLYRATKDDFYLEIAKKTVLQLEKYSRVKCGYAAIADVKTKQHEDRMDSFVYAETFKYLYLLFEEDEQMLFNIDDFIFSTEAHLLPLDMHHYALSKRPDHVDEIIRARLYSTSNYAIQNQSWRARSCPSLKTLFGNTGASGDIFASMRETTERIRSSVTQMSYQKCPGRAAFMDVKPTATTHQQQQLVKQMPLRAADFVAGRKDHMEILGKMGIKLTTMPDGRLQLVHKTSDADDYENAELGIIFMTEMLELSKQQNFQLKSSSPTNDDYRPMTVVLVSAPFNATKSYLAGPAQFGLDLRSNWGLFGELVVAEPIEACKTVPFPASLKYLGKIVLARRGECMFVEKARALESLGAIGLIVVDNNEESSQEASPLFAMSGDGVQNVKIPTLFLFGKEGKDLMWSMRSVTDLVVFLGDGSAGKHGMSGVELALNYNTQQLLSVMRKSPTLGSKSQRSVYFSDVLRALNGEPRVLECSIQNYMQLKSFYDLFATTRRDERSASTSSVVTEIDEKSRIIRRDAFDMKYHIDDVIQLLVRASGKRELTFKLDSLFNVPGVADRSLGPSERTLQVYDILLGRLERKTNFFDLPSSKENLKLVFNLVDATLNNVEISQEDRARFDQLAQQIDAKKSENLVVEAVSDSP